MNIAELFVKIGLKGGKETSKELGGVQKGMAGAVSKGMLLAETIKFVAEGLAGMVAKSGTTGASLAKFSRLTGLSVEQLQRWQFAGRKMLITNDEVAESVKSVQAAMHKQATAQGAVSGFGEVAGSVGLDESRLKDTFHVMEQLQKFAQANKSNPTKVVDVLKSFGLTENVIAGMLNNQFQSKNFQGASVYSQKEIERLEKVNAAWANIGDSIEKAIGRITAKNGTKIIDFVKDLVVQVEKLIVAFIKFADQFMIFEAINKSLEGWKMLLDGATSLGKSAGEVIEKDGITGLFSEIGSSISRLFEDDGKAFVTPGAIAPNPNKITVNQNLNFQHEGKDSLETSRSTKSATEEAFRQLPSQGQVN